MSIHASVKLCVLYSPIIASPVFPRFTSQGLQGKEGATIFTSLKNGSGRGDERMRCDSGGARDHVGHHCAQLNEGGRPQAHDGAVQAASHWHPSQAEPRPHPHSPTHHAPPRADVGLL